MLSLEQCKKIMNQNGASYSDEELKKILYWLYKLGELDYQLYNGQKNETNEKSNNLHKSINRRAK